MIWILIAAIIITAIWNRRQKREYERYTSSKFMLNIRKILRK